MTDLEPSAPPRAPGFTRLPRELVLEIVKYLGPQSLSRLARTNAGLYNLLRDSLPEAAREYAFSPEEEYKRVQSIDRRTGMVFYNPLPFQIYQKDPILMAIWHQNHDAVLNFLDAGVDPNSHVIDGCRLLYAAARSGAREIMLLLLTYGADINMANVYSRKTPLYVAALLGSDMNVTCLIYAGADVLSVDVIHLICQNCSVDTVRLAIEHGADPRQLGETEGHLTAIHFAASNPDPRVVEYICQVAPDLVNDTTFEGRTALWAATDQRLIRNVEVLIKAGINISHRDANNETPLYGSLYIIGSTEVPKLLIQSGINLNEEAEDGSTELHHAVRNNCEELTKMLLERGLSASARTRGGYTPLHSAALSGHVGIMRILIEQGDVNLNAVDAWGRSALDRARLSRNPEAAIYLEQMIEEATYRELDI